MRYVLMNPGPVNTAEEVRDALGGPDQCHREPEFAELMDRIRSRVTEICGGGPEHTSVLLTGSGTAALEAAIASAVPASGGVLVVDNGHYGERLHEIARVHRLHTVRLELGWGVPVDAAAVERALASDERLTHVAVVHHETSTGMLNDVRAVAAAARAHGRATIVDAVSSVGAEKLNLREDGVDWLVGTANKCLEGMPGLSFVCAAHESFAQGVPRTYYLDLRRHYLAQERGRAPAFTPSVPVAYAFDTALGLALKEGVAARGSRYRRLAGRLRRGLEELGLELLLPSGLRAASLTAVRLPPGLDYDCLHDGLKREGFVIYAAQEQLAAGWFRLSTMGAMTEADIDAFLAALARLLRRPR
ncbi:2-aminoethylphosphonate aminotransferase [Streptomyces sp. NPDC018610]|uniref:2-aminoethylphosphonate aminotransferase n=1 Tax=Streptomyces sp. NPDC018610 TaxID=3365049 RepID=UPI00379012E5